jgi:hypothetical protein
VNYRYAVAVIAIIPIRNLNKHAAGVLKAVLHQHYVVATLTVAKLVEVT